MFEFEKLDVYRLAIEFCKVIDTVLGSIPRNEFALIDQLKRASLSIPLNIAEGAGRWHEKEKRQFYLISRGSVFECVPILSILEIKGLISSKQNADLREMLSRLTQMLTKLSQSFSRARET